MEKIRKIFLALKFTFSYFSNIPVKIAEHENINNSTTLGYTVYLLPLVGMVLSFVTVSLYSLFEPSLYFAVIFSLLYMFLYGFIHTEAIADVVDALYAKHGGGDPYKVIKEPTVGAMGLLYTTAFLIAKTATLAYLLINKAYFEFIVISILSRSSIMILIYNFQFRSTFVTLLKESLEKYHILFFSIIYILLSYFLAGTDIILLLSITTILSFYTVRKLYKKLGFLNGDVLGFNLEIIELVLMVSIAVKLTGF